MKMTFP